MPVIDGGSSVGRVWPKKGYATGSRPKVGWAPDEAINDDFARRLAAEADTGAKNPRTRITGRNQVLQAWDENPNEHVYHFSPEENFKRGIQAEGLKASKAKGFSEGVHFAPDTKYPVIGDEPMNAYRVKKADIPDLKYRSSGDVHSLMDIAPEKIKVYTGGTPNNPGPGPRWSGLGNAYNAAATPLILASMVNSLSGMLGGPTFLSPLDNVMMQLQEKMQPPTMQERYGAGGEPEYHRMGRGRGHQKPTTRGAQYFYDEQGNMLA